MDGGFYDMYELATARETDKRKGHVGRFPWHRRTIERMIARGEFPAPVKLAGGYKNLWRKADIHKFEQELAEAARRRA